MINPSSVFKRSITSFAAVVALVLVTGSCGNEENPAPAKGKMVFAFSAASSSASNGRTQEAPKPEFVLVSVTDDQGNAQEYVRLKVLAFGNGYVSENLELATGHYRLTDFFVLDGKNKLIYSTPREGAPMAKFVKDPLDILFDIHEAENTQVRPQVLGIEDATKPGDFGYGSFGFDVVDITALVLPETTEKVVKVSYEFSNIFKTYTGESVPDGDLVDLANPKLLNNVWQAYITVWTEEKECITQYSHSPYQKVYRLTTELTFTGAAFQLPPLTSNRWDPYYYRTSRRLGFFFSANPLKSYHVEIQVPDGIVANYSWADKRYWNASGAETCNPGDGAYATVDMNGEPVGRIRMEDQPACETKDLYVVDSFVAVNSDKGAFHEFFSWTIINGVAVPSCDGGASFSGRIAAPGERKGPGSAFSH
jgi:hypothetical protein